MKKKKIGIVIPTLSDGGAERVASILSKHLSKEADLKIILTHGNRKEKIDYGYGGEIIHLDVKEIEKDYLKGINMIRKVMRLRKIKKKEKFDVVISFLFGANLLNILSKQDEKIVISVHNFPSKKYEREGGKIKKLLIKKLYNKADEIVSVSKGIKEDLIKNFKCDGKKIKSIYNPIDVEEIKRLKKGKINKKYEKIFKKNTVVNVGGLSDQKGQWHLIRAFKKVKKEIPDAQLVFLGKGELENYLRSLTKELGLKKSIHFLGFQKNPFNFVKNSGVFVLPSLFEGFGNVIIESIACEKTVISTDCKAGPREILAPKTDINFQTEKAENAEYGILVPVCDGKKHGAKERLTKEENIMADETIKLLRDKKMRNEYGKKSLKRAEDFEIEKILRKWRMLIQE